ncbi:MAG TPA: amino acid adenylation domain-containing protein [Trinickia sp.]|nr:amino acid adenylation domain-containing protein [Trinickia sp.]
MPLSFVQERLWLVQTRDGGRAYNMQVTLRFVGALSLAALQRAMDALVARHEPLRTRFDVIAGQDLPSQVIDAPRPAAFHVREIDRVRLADEITAHTSTVFDLQRGPLFKVVLLRLAPSEHVLSIVMHHIISDGWSLGVLVHDLQALYGALLRADSHSGLPPLTIQYADYAYRQRQRDLRQSLAYWSSQLSGFSAPIDLAVPGTPAGSTHGPALTCSRLLPPTLAADLAKLGGMRNTTLFTIVAAALAVVCHRQTGREDICIGTTAAGRDAPELENLIGFFINILPLRFKLNRGWTAARLLDETAQLLLDALVHQALPFEQMLMTVPEMRQADGRSPVPVILRHQNVPLQDIGVWADGLHADPLPAHVDRAAQADLDFEIFGDASGIELRATFDSHRFSAAQVDLLLAVLEETLERIVREPHASLSAFGEPTQVEKVLIGAANDTTRCFEEAGIVDLFAEHVRARPEALASRYEGEDLTYAGLDRRANGIAAALHRRGIGSGARVALCLPRSNDFLASLLAIFKLGAVYVPVDPAYPAAYVARILEHAEPAIIVATPVSPAMRSGIDVPLLLLDAALDIEPSSSFQPVKAHPDDIAYIAYTSGSTGQPKGVMVQHRQLLNCLSALWDRLPYAPDEVVGQKTSMAFVPSIKEMLSGLLAGVPQIIFPDPTVVDSAMFAAQLLEHRVTRLNLVPSHLDVLLEHADSLGSLCHVTTAGEPLSRSLAVRFSSVLPHAQLHNNYGCSELNDIAYCTAPRSVECGTLVPAGRPIANTRVHVLDEHMQPVPVGAVGAVHVEGASVGPGYWKEPDLSAQRFVAHPSLGRMLRTGDIGMWLADGQLYHLGREDFQVKIRGQRVEASAVEIALASHPDIAKAAVAGRDLGTPQAQLMGFYVSRDGKRIDSDRLHQWLSERLPIYMVPARFVRLDALPLLPNGKLNRLALSALDIDVHDDDAAPRNDNAPQGELEQTIARVWCQVLGVQQLRRHDNFFALGGHSLMAAQLATRLSKELDIKLSVRTIFDTRTVHKLASLIRSEQAPNGDMPYGNEAGTPGADFVAFNTSGTQRPLFLAHTLQGYSWYFEHLAAHIDADIPVYGLPPLRLGMPQPHTVEAIAARFVTIVKDVQPVGPYRLAGWSFGGLIAYEIATQLIRQGDEVEFLGVLDTTLPDRSTEVDPHRAALLTLYSFAVNNFSNFDPQTIDFEGASSIDMLIAELVQAIETRRAADTPLWHLAYDTADENRFFLERLVAHGLAMNAWRPTPIDTKAHVFAAEDTSITPLEGHATLPARLGWEAVLDRANIEVLTIPGNHETIVKFHADVLGLHISDLLTMRSLVE